MSEPTDDWPCKFDGSSKLEREGINFAGKDEVTLEPLSKAETDFTFPCGQVTTEDDDEVTESKIRAFLDEKVK